MERDMCGAVIGSRRGDVDRWLSDTRDGNAAVRSRAVRELCPCHVHADVEPVWSRIFAMTADPDLHVRKTVLHALIDGSPRAREAEVVAAMGVLARDGDERLRRNAKRLLNRYRGTGRINHH